MIWLFIAFIVKHFVVDFLLQPPYMFLNKGKYGHIGGIAHSLVHVSVSIVILSLTRLFIPISDPILLICLWGELLLHYHIDWGKEQIKMKTGWGPNTHAEFWYLTGADQMLHYLTYAAMIGIVH